MKHVLLALAAAATLAACASSHVLVGTQRPAISPAQVKVYMDMPANAEKVALLKADSSTSFTFTQQGATNYVVNKLKQEAASLGANGIVLQSMSTETSPMSAQTVDYGNGYSSTAITSSSEQMGSAIAIYVP